MDFFLKTIFYISGFIISWAMVGYPLSLKVLNKIFSKNDEKNYSFQPTVTVLVVAHNEEQVIIQKLNNLINLNYPSNKLDILVSSDNSTDKTNELVNNFIKENKTQHNIYLYEVSERKGKTNAQNEAQKIVKTEYLVLTDANSILNENSITELMASFTSEKIAYVAGRLSYIDSSNKVSKNEKTYWDRDLIMREIEGNIQTITAGNGALYACRVKDYHDFDPIESHDSAMPIYFALKGKRAIANHEAVAYEKAAEVIEEEFRRKVRMNRVLLKHIIPSIRIFNFFKYKWFTFFYFGHRTCRYLLWISHLLLLISNLIILFISPSWFYLAIFVAQVLFYILALLKHVLNIESKIVNLPYYYSITILAQWLGVIKTLTGNSKPFWEKAESTR